MVARAVRPASATAALPLITMVILATASAAAGLSRFNAHDSIPRAACAGDRTARTRSREAATASRTKRAASPLPSVAFLEDYPPEFVEYRVCRRLFLAACSRPSSTNSNRDRHDCQYHSVGLRYFAQFDNEEIVIPCRRGKHLPVRVADQINITFLNLYIVDVIETIGTELPYPLEIGSGVIFGQKRVRRTSLERAAQCTACETGNENVARRIHGYGPGAVSPIGPKLNGPFGLSVCGYLRQKGVKGAPGKWRCQAATREPRDIGVAGAIDRYAARLF